MSPEGGSSREAEVIFAGEQLGKRYGAVVALEGVDLVVRAGQVHAIIGQNGAGKSTLVRIVAGVENPDQGRTTFWGDEVRPGLQPPVAGRGIAYVSQEGNLNPGFTVTDNVFLGREAKRFGLLDRARMRAEVQALLARYDLHLDLDRPVEQLNPAKRKLAEFVRALAMEPRLLILDEPTAALPQPDIEHLLGVIRGLAARGIGVLFISHYLQEVFAVASEVSVLRDGRLVWTGGIDETTPRDLVRQMIGRDVTERPGSRRPHLGLVPILTVSGLETTDGTVRHADLRVESGRVLGVFGVVGAGKSELLEAVFGMRAVVAGKLSLDGQPVRRWGPREAIAAGVALVPEDRLTKSLLPERSIAWNVAMPYWDSLPRRSGVVAGEARIGDAVVSRLQIRASSAASLVEELSGGNKQKVSIGRWLGDHAQSRVFLFDEPTQGLDVGARESVYELIGALCEQGAAIVVASSDLDEVLRLSDDIVVVRNGVTTSLDEDSYEPTAVLGAAT